MMSGSTLAHLPAVSRDQNGVTQPAVNGEALMGALPIHVGT
jgi:hypothetical protein